MSMVSLPCCKSSGISAGSQLHPSIPPMPAETPRSSAVHTVDLPRTPAGKTRYQAFQERRTAGYRRWQENTVGCVTTRHGVCVRRQVWFYLNELKLSDNLRPEFTTPALPMDFWELVEAAGVEVEVRPLVTGKFRVEAIGVTTGGGKVSVQS